VKEKISEFDNNLLKIVDALPTKTLVILTADHGMHDVNENGRYGNHGNLISKDMLIPIFLLKK
jgi:aromatic ring-opening dioxygenase LigB subunit